MEVEHMFCQRIRDLREDKDLTQIQVAQELGLHTTQYARYERGDFKKIPFDFIIDLAKFYDVSIEYIAGTIDTPIKRSDIIKLDKKRKSL